MTTTAQGTATTEETQKPLHRYNGECKGCKKVASVLARRTKNVLKDGNWRQGYATEGGVEMTSGTNDFSAIVIDCPAGCKQLTNPEKPRRMMLSRVRGTFNAAVKCNAKCQMAKRHLCECACGGKNHGSGFSI